MYHSQTGTYRVFKVEDETFSISLSVLEHEQKDTKLGKLIAIEELPVYHLEGRDKNIFREVANVLQKGKIRLPKGISKDVVLRELHHFELNGIDQMDIQEYSPPEENPNLDETDAILFEEEEEVSGNGGIEQAEALDKGIQSSECVRINENISTSGDSTSPSALNSVGVITEAVKEQRSLHHVCETCIEYLLEHEIHLSNVNFTIDLSTGIGAKMKDDISLLLRKKKKSLKKLNKFLSEALLKILDMESGIISMRKI